MRSAKMLLSAVLILSTLSYWGCAKEDNNPSAPAETYSLWVLQGEDSTEVSAEGLPTIDLDGLQAIHVSEFINTTLIPPFVDDPNEYDSRPLYAYEITGADGFSAHANRGYANNTWVQLTQGAIVLSTKRISFPAELGLPGAYNVSDVARIVVQRKFDLVTPDTTAFVEFRTVTPVEVTNHDGLPEMALPLSRFVDPEVIATPEAYAYNMRSVDDFGPTETMSWEQLQTGYWLIDSERTIFTDASLAGGRYKLRYLEKILAEPLP